MRLACLYALLDRIDICEPHLQAALALWKYSEGSALYIFGDSLGDPLADVILTHLRGAPKGMSRTEISKVLHRNKETSEISRALQSLAESRKARMETRDEGPGRRTEVWFAC